MKPDLHSFCLALSALFCLTAASISNGADQLVPVSRALLAYDVYLANLPAAEVEVDVELSEDAYRVTGTARTAGMLERFSPWRGAFLAEGARSEAGGLAVPPTDELKPEDGASSRAPQLREFRTREESGSAWREISIVGGARFVARDDQPRERRGLLPGVDALTALFVDPSCGQSVQVHSGRESYRLEPLPDTQAYCRFRVHTEDEDRYELALTLARRSGVQVPEALLLDGPVPVRIELRSAAEQDPAGAVKERPGPADGATAADQQPRETEG